MKMNQMTKDDFIWVAISVFGIYLIVLAIIEIPGLFSSMYKPYAFWDYDPPKTNSEMDVLLSFASKIRDRELSSFLYSAIRVFLYFVIGSFFLRRGKFIYKMINKSGNIEGENET